MCQLLGMNCNVPTDICFSFKGFATRGGKTDHHKDGWGIAFFEGSGCRLFLDNKPSFESPVADLVLNYPIRSTNVIAHIRKASVGPVSIENCHPFQRELWGKYWVFAHNGDVPHVEKYTSGFYKPVGQTDSEKAFCIILETLRARFPKGKPALEKLRAALEEITHKLTEDGVFNYLLSDGEDFFAHCSTNLCYIVRRAPFAAAHLVDQDVTVDFKELTTQNDRVTVIATKPLTDNETWTQMKPGELIAFRDGEPKFF